MQDAQETHRQALRALAAPIIGRFFEQYRAEFSTWLDQRFSAFENNQTKRVSEVERRLMVPVTTVQELRTHFGLGVPVNSFGVNGETWFSIDDATNVIDQAYVKRDGEWHLQGQFPAGSLTFVSAPFIAIGSSTANQSPYTEKTLSGAIDGANRVFQLSENAGTLIDIRRAVFKYRGRTQWDWAYDPLTAQVTTGPNTGWAPDPSSQGHELQLEYYPPS